MFSTLISKYSCTELQLVKELKILERPPIYLVLTPACSLCTDLGLGLGFCFLFFCFFQEEGQISVCSFQFLAQNFTPENIQAGSLKNSDGGLW